MRPKNRPPSANWLAEELERVRKRRGEYIRSRFCIIEITPPKRESYGDGHGGTEYGWSMAKRNRVSGYFPTREQAQAFMDLHEPDRGKSLEIKEEKLYRRVVEEWV